METSNTTTMTNLQNYIPFQRLYNKKINNILVKSYPFIIAIYIFTCWNASLYFTSGTYPFHTFNRIIRIALACIVLFKIYFLDQSNLKTLLIYTGILICFGINMLVTKQILMFCTVICALGAKDVSYGNISKAAFYTIALTMLATFTMCSFGIVINYMHHIRTISIDSLNITFQIPRNTFGFYHPNRFGLWCLLLLLSGTQAYFERIKLWHIFICFAYVLLFWSLCDSRASTFAAIIYIILLFFFKCNSKINIHLNKFAIIFIVLSALIIILYYFFIINYGKLNFIEFFNQLSSLRISLSQKGISESALTFFGTSNPTQTAMECLYVSLPFKNGIIPAALWFIGYCFAMLRAGKHKNEAIIILLFIVFLYSAMESNMTCHFNLGIYAISCLLALQTEK